MGWADDGPGTSRYKVMNYVREDPDGLRFELELHLS